MSVEHIHFLSVNKIVIPHLATHSSDCEKEFNMSLYAHGDPDSSPAPSLSRLMSQALPHLSPSLSLSYSQRKCFSFYKNTYHHTFPVSFMMDTTLLEKAYVILLQCNPQSFSVVEWWNKLPAARRVSHPSDLQEARKDSSFPRELSSLSHKTDLHSPAALPCKPGKMPQSHSDD